MEPDTTQTKIKYIEYLQPLVDTTKGSFYKADGTIVRNNQQRGDLGYQNLVDDETTMRFAVNNTGCKGFEVQFGNSTYQLCKERERNLDTSEYIRNGNMVNRGFGDMEVLSRIQFGENTRQVYGTVSDAEVDRNHLTHRNFGVVGDFAFPEDTRYVNKKYTNY